jgi:hypothetical protein
LEANWTCSSPIFYWISASFAVCHCDKSRSPRTSSSALLRCSRSYTTVASWRPILFYSLDIYTRSRVLFSDSVLRPGQLLLDVDELSLPSVHFQPHSVQLGPLVFHTPQRDFKWHLGPSRDGGRREGGWDHREGLNHGRSSGICPRGIHFLSHSLQPKSQTPRRLR